MTKDEALKLALEVLKSQIVWFSTDTMIGKSMRQKTEKAITALEEALAQPEQEPVGEAQQMAKFVEGFTHCIWDARVVPVGTKLYTTPPQRKPDNKAYTALEQALTRLQKRYGELEAKVAAQQKPVAHCKVRPLRGDESFPKVEIDWVSRPVPGPLYTTPPQRKPLKDEDLRKLADKHLYYQTESYEESGVFDLSRAIEAAHGIKENT